VGDVFFLHRLIQIASNTLIFGRTACMYVCKQSFFPTNRSLKMCEPYFNVLEDGLHTPSADFFIKQANRKKDFYTNRSPKSLILVNLRIQS
jgi:hypothetical protein